MYGLIASLQSPASHGMINSGRREVNNDQQYRFLTSVVGHVVNIVDGILLLV